MPRMGKKLFKQEIENVVIELEALKASHTYTQRMIALSEHTIRETRAHSTD
jgi:hypothetical protein